MQKVPEKIRRRYRQLWSVIAWLSDRDTVNKRPFRGRFDNAVAEFHRLRARYHLTWQDHGRMFHAALVALALSGVPALADDVLHAVKMESRCECPCPSEPAKRLDIVLNESATDALHSPAPESRFRPETERERRNMRAAVLWGLIVGAAVGTLASE